MILMCVVEIDLSVATKLNKNEMESLDVIMKICHNHSPLLVVILSSDVFMRWK